ncbi:hypothetical protein MPTK1_1g18320 [Marchantia polymorpha subsp. ruderalis]|uniref:Uncharacterized protein n=2 Tax=Marchantia polymorpha TaxID=3197 RepID=A0A176WB47_MARPO|nr:hypothetical protein AXG93_773s1740 [Marchantia polymorpha subsp. ruderalis]PTQ50129.1 hypothetical protein MARPO_0001s0170 [Marchantia polymorpha]BBM99053.1 hypothetical protein Mp_1g18320 [Marchantia polymorpha subsp. ruderalis]|eukprot:PTQ50129.1 hypothetical protein MARPO_0001s0170 [Marchantia polymorpha]
MAMVLFKDEDDEVLYDDVLLAAVDAAVSRQLRRTSQHAAAPALTLPAPPKKLMSAHSPHQNFPRAGAGGGHDFPKPGAFAGGAGVGVDSKQQAAANWSNGRRPLQELAPSVGRRWVDSHEMVERPSSTMWVQAEVCSPTKEREGSWFSGLAGVSMFKECQDAAMKTLVPSDYMMMQGKPFIKKSGWRKIAFFFNISFEIKDKNIQFDSNSNVLRAEFVVRASMPTGRFTDSWGSCDRGEKRFSKPNHDIPSTAETRAKTRACQDLLGIGEYKLDGGAH